MHKILIILLIFSLVVSCTPKLSTSSTVEDYSEDVSAFRPIVPIDVDEETELSEDKLDRGPYVAPTHSINREMSNVMDSIIVYNRDKSYFTYTVQVYIGRSREEANQAREKVYRVLPEEKPELAYKQPSYKVKVGRYYDRVEAYKTLTKLRGTFPGAGMVRERNYME